MPDDRSLLARDLEFVDVLVAFGAVGLRCAVDRLDRTAIELTAIEDLLHERLGLEMLANQVSEVPLGA